MATASIYKPGEITESIEYTTKEEILDQIPDNEDNIISAQDVRDAIYTLWQRNQSLFDGATFSLFFQNDDPTPFKVGGIPAGTSFPNPTNMQDMWDKLLYPYVEPEAFFTTSDKILQLGESKPVQFNWKVVKKTNDITSIIVQGSPVVTTGNTQTGTITVNAVSSITPQLVTLSATDGTEVITDTASISWLNKIYWGNIDIGGLNLTTNPSDSSLASSFVDSSFIRSLLGNKLSSTITNSYNGINGSGNHLIFAWPSSFTNSKTPTFTVNGLNSTAFTNIKTDWSFTNQHGYITDYEVWISNTVQNSPISLFNIN